MGAPDAWCGLVGAPVRYYELGTERWLSADRLDAIGPRTRTFFLSSDGTATSLSRAGKLSDSPATGALSSRWTYDPHDLRRELEPPTWAGEWITKGSPPEDLWGSGLAFQTDRFSEPLRMAGSSRSVVFLALDVPDTDFAVRLEWVSPTGEALLLGEHVARARYRSSLVRAEKIPPGVPLGYRFLMPFVARSLPAGSRLRLLFYSPNSPFDGKNWNGGGAVADESGRDGRIAHPTLFHGRSYRSRIEVALAD